ncbi:MAG: thioredoxin family protein [Vampirovibrionales bacterium]|nr:thioredoxin family protein [Vampirovibrionales bacterium]
MTFYRAMAVFGWLTGLGLSLLSLSAAWAEEGRVVVFSAEWCANCRDVLPIIQDSAQELGIPVFVIDVDRQDAARQAKNFGLAIPTTEPPQAYWVADEHQLLLFDGRTYDPSVSGAKLKKQVTQKLNQRSAL